MTKFNCIAALLFTLGHKMWFNIKQLYKPLSSNVNWTSHVRLLVGWLVGRSVGRSVAGCSVVPT